MHKFENIKELRDMKIAWNALRDILGYTAYSINTSFNDNLFISVGNSLVDEMHSLLRKSDE